jgi:hypothetical protein
MDTPEEFATSEPEDKLPEARGQEKIEKPTKSEEPLEEVVPRLDCRVVGFQTNDFESVNLCAAQSSNCSDSRLKSVPQPPGSPAAKSG